MKKISNYLETNCIHLPQNLKKLLINQCLKKNMFLLFHQSDIFKGSWFKYFSTLINWQNLRKNNIHQYFMSDIRAPIIANWIERFINSLHLSLLIFKLG